MARPRKIDQLAQSDDLICDDRVVHIEAVQEARTALPVGKLLGGMAEVFAALGDPTRLKILAALSMRELCVCDLAATVAHTESAVSHQLRLLKSLGLVRSRRDGRLVFYTLDDEHVAALYGQAFDHVGHRIKEELT